MTCGQHICILSIGRNPPVQGSGTPLRKPAQIATAGVTHSFTNAQRDLVDWYKIEFENERRDKYLLDGEYIATDKKIEEFKQGLT